MTKRLQGAPQQEPEDLTNFNDANAAMQLSPQEQNLYKQHLYNLNNAPVKNKDGSVSTLFQAGVEGPDGKEYNIPTVWNGKILPVPEAIKKAAEKGWGYWPSYDDPDTAEQRYQTMHDFMERDTENYLKKKGRK